MRSPFHFVVSNPNDVPILAIRLQIVASLMAMIMCMMGLACLAFFAVLLVPYVPSLLGWAVADPTFATHLVSRVEFLPNLLTEQQLTLRAVLWLLGGAIWFIGLGGRLLYLSDKLEKSLGITVR